MLLDLLYNLVERIKYKRFQMWNALFPVIRISKINSDPTTTTELPYPEAQHEYCDIT
jgi:hypothetical protein